jgi:signal transduction histidine kinase
MDNPNPERAYFDDLNRFLQSLIDQGDERFRPGALAAQEKLRQIEILCEQQVERERLAALYEVSRALGSSLELEEVLSQVMDSVIHLTGAERGLLILLDSVTHEPTLTVTRNFQAHRLDTDEMEISRTIIQAVLRTGTGIVTSNAQQDARFTGTDSITRFSLRSILCEPLRVKGRTLGTIYVDNKIRSGVFKDDDRQMLEALAAQAAVAIENARLYSQVDASLTKRIAELEILQNIDRELNTTLDFERVLDLTVIWATQGTAADEGWIAIRPDGGGEMIIATGVRKGAKLELDEAAFTSVQEAGAYMTSHERNGPHSIYISVRREGSPIAVICVIRKGRPFTLEAREFLIRLADHSAAAIENARLYRALQDANYEKSQFISIVSHELKTPMTSIRGYADLIRQGAVGQVTDQQKKFLDTIRLNVDRMANLVSDLSDISRIETGRLKVSISEISVGDYLRETLAGLRPQIETKQQQVQLDIPQSLPMVCADRARLIQILTNLISNANKYTPEGGQITISASEERGRVIVRVKDTGIGMTEADQARLFTQFFRSEDQEVRDELGWGLGLYVTRRLVELLNGEIGADSEIGIGSTFWFTLPIAPCN